MHKHLPIAGFLMVASAAAAPVTFQKDVLPILQKNCPGPRLLITDGRARRPFLHKLVLSARSRATRLLPRPQCVHGMSSLVV